MNSPSINESNSSRRTFSSPYLASVRDTRARSQYRPRPGVPSQNKNTNFASNVRFERSTPRPPPRGSRSAPPNYHSNSVHPEIHEYYQRRAELQKQVQKTLLKSKLDRLLAYQQELTREINDLEKGCGDAGIRPSKQPTTESKPAAGTKLKQFRVLGGCQGNLSYKIHRKPDKFGKIRSFSIEIDVRGFMAEKVHVDTDDSMMTVKASKMNGTSKDLKIVAPTTKDMEKAYVHHPRFGVLVLDF